MGIAAAGYTTWSHGKDERVHSYRILTDLVARDWPELQDVVRQISQVISVPIISTRSEKGGIDPASWTSAWFYYPAVPKGRLKTFRSDRTKLERSAWEPKPFTPPERPEPKPPGERRASSEDEAKIRDALSYIDNYDRDTWLQVGAALQWTALPNAKQCSWSADDLVIYRPDDDRRGDERKECAAFLRDYFEKPGAPLAALAVEVKAAASERGVSASKETWTRARRDAGLGHRGHGRGAVWFQASSRRG